MKTLYQIKCKIDNVSTVVTVKACTDRECTKLSNTGKFKFLAPSSHGFVNLFDAAGFHVGWCGENWAASRKMSTARTM